jgi:hypothetical protein
MRLNSILKRLEALLPVYNPSFLFFLNTGLTDEAINQLFGESILPFPDDFYTLYNWRNGTTWRPEEKQRFIAKTATYLFPLAAFMPLEEALYAYKHLAGKDEYWRTSMFPIFESFGGDYFLLDTSAEDGRIYFYTVNDESDDWCIPIFGSLALGFQTILRWYEESALTYNDEEKRVKKANRDRYIAIAREVNPKCRYWKTYEW